MNQPKLFEQSTGSVALKDVLLYALGDFQSRGKVLANRELALDRLRGAFLRAFAKFGIAELSDDSVAEVLRQLGANVVEVPNYVAKRPFRVKVNTEMGKRALELFKEKSGSR
jgi:hypothetical protein